MVLVSSLLMTETSMEAEHAVVLGLETPILDSSTPPLKHILCIYYPLYFRKDQPKIQALIDFGSKVNAMTPAYAKQLGLQTWKTYVRVWKTNDSSLITYEMVIAIRISKK